jgi:hypothetical protein
MTDATSVTDVTSVTNLTDMTNATTIHTETDMNTDMNTDTETNTSTAEDTEPDDSQDSATRLDLSIRRQENPVGSSYPWNRSAVVIDAETGDECVCALSLTGDEPHDNSALHIAAPLFLPATRARCRPGWTGRKNHSIVPFRVSEFDSEDLRNQLCGTCISVVSSTVADYLNVRTPTRAADTGTAIDAETDDSDRSIVPRIVAGRRVIFFETGESDTGELESQYEY